MDDSAAELAPWKAGLDLGLLLVELLVALHLPRADRRRIDHPPLSGWMRNWPLDEGAVDEPRDVPPH
eukprot:6615314-Pyramimonas_sp.AAC.1